MLFLLVFSRNELIVKVIYHWMNMFKPLMHSFHQTAAILKLTDKHKGPSGSVRGVRNEIPALIKQYHNSQWKTQTVNPRCVEQKRKACQSKLIFFTVQELSKI